MHSWRLIPRCAAIGASVALVATGLFVSGAHDGSQHDPAHTTAIGQSVAPESTPQAAPDKVVPPTPVKAPVVTDQQTAVPTVATNPSTSAKSRVVAELPKTTTKNFGTVGVTWSAATQETDVRVAIRTRTSGTWSAWESLDLDDSSAGGRPGTEPIWVGKADGIAARVKTASGNTPEDIKVMTIDAGATSADVDLATVTQAGSDVADPTTASSAAYTTNSVIDGTARATTVASSTGLPPQPAIILRSAWGAAKPKPCDSPRTVSKTKGAIVHHTAGSNSYSKADSAKIVRGDQAYHMKGHGWCDLGYNFIVDKYGQIFEGRAGGITKQVRAAHSGVNEVNTYAMGVSMAGTFTKTEPSTAMKDAMTALISWRFGQMRLKAKGTWYVNTKLKATYSPRGGHTLELISGHRNVVGTECPGEKAYKWLSAKNGLRDRVEDALKTGGESAVQKPSVVTGLKAVPASDSASLSWNSAANAETYSVCLTTNAKATVCSSVLPSQKGTSVVAEGLKPNPGADYFFTVTARNDAGSSTSAKLRFDLPTKSAISTESYTVTSARSVPIAGHGYGHGIGMSQYGAEGAAKQGLKYDQILRYYYPGTALSSKSGSIRVLISADTTDSVMVKSTSGLKFRNLAKKSVISLPASISGKSVIRWSIVPTRGNGKQSTLQYRTSSVWKTYKNTKWTGEAQFEGPSKLTLIMPNDSGKVVRGALRSALPKSGATYRNTVNSLSIEDYTRGVVAAEMPSSWMPEALKAQSVAARTYGVRSITSARYYDICDTTACQVYSGVSRETKATDAAIAGTKGDVLTYKGAPALTQFSSSSGGWTAKGSQPYQASKADPYDGWSGNPNHSWKVRVSAATIERAYPSIGKLKQLRVTKRAGGGEWGGRVNSLSLIGSKKTISIAGTDARFKFGLKSHWFHLGG